MFLLENPSSENPDPLFFLSLGMGSVIDFCVWVLEKDGLQVPPFNRHPDGDGSLRSRGMTAEAWRSWIARTALLIDQRYFWQTDLQATEPQVDPVLELQQLHRQIKAENPDLALPPFDAPAIVEQLDRHEVWQAEQLEKFQVALCRVYGDTIPPAIWAGDEEIAAWQGSPEVAERLRELQSEYPFRQRERLWVMYELDANTDFPVGVGEMAIDTQQLPETVRSHWEGLGSLELHLVAYPYSVEYAIAPNAVVMSPSHDPGNQQQFEERFVQVVDLLVALNEAEQS